MVGVSNTASSTKPKVPKGARDLYRFICALSGACQRDSNVLKDGHLVDSLELQAKQIMRSRRQNSSTGITGAPPTKLSKRRQRPADYGKIDHHDAYDKSPVMCPSSSSTRGEDDKASLHMARDDGSSSLIPSVKIGKIEPSSYSRKVPSYMALGNEDVIVNSVAISTSPSHMEQFSLVKPVPVGRTPRESLDFGASMVSTVSSSSMAHYDLSDAELLSPTSLTPNSRYALASHSYEYDDYTPPRRMQSIQSINGDDSLLYMSELRAGSPYRKDSCYSETSTSSLNNDRATPKKLRFDTDALSLYERDEVCGGIRSSSSISLKNVESSLVETLQSQVDLLLTENVKALTENARLSELSMMSACEAEEHLEAKRRYAEQVKQQNDQLEAMETKCLESEKRADAQEDIRREAERAFQAELDAKAELVAALQKQMQLKDEEIGRLTKRVDEIGSLLESKFRAHKEGRLSDVGSSLARTSEVASSNVDVVSDSRESNLFLDRELERMRSLMMEKDREICNLYMHLSTKKNLIEEITKRFVQHMEDAAAASEVIGAAAPLPTEGVRFDLDMFLFKNVVDKQRQMEELTAAIGVMDREVESLEARVAEKELENRQLREQQDFLTRNLHTANAQVCRLQAENERLELSVRENTARMVTLSSSLVDQERQVRQLNEQLEVEQAHATGRRSLKNSFVKARESYASPSVKSASRVGVRDAEKENSGRSGCMSLSTARTARRERSASLNQKTSDWVRPRGGIFSEVFNDISAPLGADEEKLFGSSMAGDDSGNLRASVCASAIRNDEELYNELFAKV